MVSLSTRRWVHLRHDIFLEQRATSNSYYGGGNIMCWNVCLCSMHFFDICLFLSSHVLHLFIHLLIFCHTGWNPFFSAVSTMKDCKDSKFCTSPGAWRRFLRQQAQWFPRWNTLVLCRNGCTHRAWFLLFFSSQWGWIKIQWWWKQTQKLLEAVR